MEIDLKEFDRTLWSIPNDKLNELGFIAHYDETTVLHHNSKVIDLGYAKAESVDLMQPVKQMLDGRLKPKGDHFSMGYYSIEAKVLEANEGFHSAPIWFVADRVMPEIDVVEQYKGRKMQTNIHFGKTYGSDTHFQSGQKEHYTFFNRLFYGMKFFGWNKFEMEWGKGLKFYYNGRKVREIKEFHYSSYIIPIISVKNGTIAVKNFVYEK